MQPDPASPRTLILCRLFEVNRMPNRLKRLNVTASITAAICFPLFALISLLHKAFHGDDCQSSVFDFTKILDLNSLS